MTSWRDSDMPLSSEPASRVEGDPVNDENRENAPDAFFPAPEASDASVSPGPEAAGDGALDRALAEDGQVREQAVAYQLNQRGWSSPSDQHFDLDVGVDRPGDSHIDIHGVEREGRPERIIRGQHALLDDGDPYDLDPTDHREADEAISARREVYVVRDRLAIQTSDGYFTAIVKNGTTPWSFLSGLPTNPIGSPPTVFTKLEVEDPNRDGTMEVMIRVGAIDSVQPVWR